MERRWFVTATLLVVAGASPVRADSNRADLRSSNLPIISLPYATYQASRYEAVADVYVFRNIRFAAPPVGNLRFAKPAKPMQEDGIQKGDKGGTCHQQMPAQFMQSSMGSAGGSLMSSLLSAVDIGKLMGGGPSSEDCLFLDLYVPGRALKEKLRLPVINWIYGGAFVVGNKEKNYNGTAILHAANNEAVFITSNYRLGALGWLAGSTMEQDQSAISNAGLWDQRAVLEWIQKYITNFGGDPEDVTIIGESAGGSSILHHITAFGGKQDPLFKKAIIQSPAFSVEGWDRKGANEALFKKFEKEAGCEGQGLACLRTKPIEVINKAQTKITRDAGPGSFGFGPSVDGGFVRQLPQLELMTSNYADNLDSLIISHMTEEANNFVPSDAKGWPEQAFVDIVNRQFGNNTSVAKAITEHMPITRYESERDRLIKYAQFSTFTCNTRFLTQAFKTRAYNVAMTGPHGRDVFANFWSDTKQSNDILAATIGGIQGQKFQRYITSLARSGDPNKFKHPDAPQWPKSEFGPQIEKTLHVSKGFGLGGDDLNAAKECDLWIDVFSAVTNDAGYAPPGAVVESRIATAVTDPSRNFIDRRPTRSN